jgi:uncharacterized small protein (DUF1192 family)
MSSKERIDEYRTKVTQLHQIMNEKLSAFGKDVEKQKISALKGEIARLRLELLAALEKPMKDSLDSVLTDEQKKMRAISQPHSSSVWEWREWNHTDWIDGMTRYAITAIGACLILGLFTRTACLGGACFLILVYLAMPAFPWLPESSRAEGHYLFVNKNVIEMLALLALATTRSGRWLGLDGLIGLLLPGRRRSQPVSRPGQAPHATVSR